MEEEWDAEGFDPKVIKAGSKWDDEDADDEVKDNWEDEDEEEEEKKDTEKQEDRTAVTSQPPKKNKKYLARKIEEKERQESRKQLTPEEKLAEKLHQQKLQEEADLKVARETFGVTAEASGGLDAMNPDTKEDFEEFSKALVKKIIPYSSNQNFPNFVEELVRNMCVNMNSNDIKKLKNTIDNLQLEKAKIEKGDKAKKNKGKGKAKLRIEGDSAIVNEYPGYGDMDEYEDFM